MTDAADNDLGIGQGGLGRVITVAILSIAIVVLMVTFLVWNTQETDRAKSLFMYCAAGMRRPLEEIAMAYEDEFGVRVELNFGGSNSLLNQLEVSRMVETASHSMGP